MSDDPAPPGVPDWMRAHMTSDERALGRVEGRLDSIETKLDQALAAHSGRLEKHDGEIRSLQLWRAYLAGVGAVLLILVSYLLGK